MMESTSNMCQQLHVTPKKELQRELPKAAPRPDKKAREMQKHSIHKMKEEKEKKNSTDRLEEKTPKRSLSSKSQQKEATTSSKKQATNFSVKLNEEPKDLVVRFWFDILISSFDFSFYSIQ